MKIIPPNQPTVEAALREILRPIVIEAVREVLAERSAEPPAEWLSTVEAAKVLDIHPKTLERMARSKEIPSARVGRCLRFRRADLETYLARGGR
jgi:excisionase family DNA binding protein